MSDARYFVPLPAFIGAVITSVVRAFAEGKGLQAESWVHDLPLWLVTSVDRNTGIVRRVQVGAYSLPPSDEVRLIPQVFRFSERRRVLLAFEQAEPKEIRHLPLSQAIVEKELHRLLVETWAAALRLAPPQDVEQPNSRLVQTIEVSPKFKL